MLVPEGEGTPEQVKEFHDYMRQSYLTHRASKQHAVTCGYCRECRHWQPRLINNFPPGEYGLCGPAATVPMTAVTAWGAYALPGAAEWGMPVKGGGILLTVHTFGCNRYQAKE